MLTGNPDANLRVNAYETPAQAIQLIRDFLAQNSKL
jgi:hypothetical protein